MDQCCLMDTCGYAVNCTSPPSHGLPYTGTDLLAYVAVGIVLVVLGCLVRYSRQGADDA